MVALPRLESPICPTILSLADVQWKKKDSCFSQLTNTTDISLSQTQKQVEKLIQTNIPLSQIHRQIERLIYSHHLQQELSKSSNKILFLYY